MTVRWYQTRNWHRQTDTQIFADNHYELSTRDNYNFDHRKSPYVGNRQELDHRQVLSLRKVSSRADVWEFVHYVYICTSIYMYVYTYVHICTYVYLSIRKVSSRVDVWEFLPWGRHFESVAVCCSVLQCVAVCCSVLQCVAVCYVWKCLLEGRNSRKSTRY